MARPSVKTEPHARKKHVCLYIDKQIRRASRSNTRPELISHSYSPYKRSTRQASYQTPDQNSSAMACLSYFTNLSTQTVSSRLSWTFQNLIPTSITVTMPQTHLSLMLQLSLHLDRYLLSKEKQEEWLLITHLRRVSRHILREASLWSPIWSN